MAGFDQSNLGSILKSVYSPEAIRVLQNFESPLLGRIGNGRATLGGNGFIFAVNSQSNMAFRPSGDTQALPTAQRQQVQQATVVPRVMLGTVQITGLAKAIANNNSHSFASVAQYDLAELIKAITHYQEGQVFRSNVDRILRLNEASPSGTDLTVDNGQIQNVKRGMVIDFVTDAGARTASATVSDVSWVNSTITTSVDVSALLTDNDGIFLTGVQDGNGSLLARGYDGLEGGTAASGTYLGLSKSTFPAWAGNVITASGPLDEDLLMQAFNRVRVEVGADARDFALIAHPSAIRRFMEVAYPRQRFSGSSVDLGVSEVKFNGQTFIDVVTIPDTDVYGVAMSELKRFETPNGSLQLSDDFGGTGIKWLNGFDAGLGYVRSYNNVVLTNPKKAFRIQSLSDVASR